MPVSEDFEAYLPQAHLYESDQGEKGRKGLESPEVRTRGLPAKARLTESMGCANALERSRVRNSDRLLLLHVLRDKPPRRHLPKDHNVLQGKIPIDHSIEKDLNSRRELLITLP